MGNVQRAKETCGEILKINKESSDVHLCRGIVYSREGNLLEALSELDQASALSTSLDSRILVERAQVKYRLGKLFDAISDLESAARLLPNDYDIELKLAAYNLEALRTNEALDHYNKVLALHPGDFYGLLGRCEAYIRFQRFDEAFSDCNSVIENFVPNEDSYRAYLDRGFIYTYGFKDYEKAIKDYKKSIEYNPTIPETYAELGHVYVVIKDYSKAKAIFGKYLELTNKPSTTAKEDMALVDKYAPKK